MAHQFAKVTFGYDTFVLPLKDATKLVELLAAATPVEHAEYSLVEFRPELAGKYIEVQKDVKIEMALVQSAPVPYFDQKAALAEERAKKFGPEIAPFTIGTSGSTSQYAVFDAAGVEIEATRGWAYSEVLTAARAAKAALAE
jgi:hypothetical protein